MLKKTQCSTLAELSTHCVCLLICLAFVYKMQLWESLRSFFQIRFAVLYILQLEYELCPLFHIHNSFFDQLLQVITNLGLCVSVYDIQSIKDHFILPNDGHPTLTVYILLYVSSLFLNKVLFAIFVHITFRLILTPILVIRYSLFAVMGFESSWFFFLL